MATKSSTSTPYKLFKPTDQLRTVEERIRTEESNHYRLTLDALTTRNEDGARVVKDGVRNSESTLAALYTEYEEIKPLAEAENANANSGTPTGPTGPITP